MFTVVGGPVDLNKPVDEHGGPIFQGSVDIVGKFDTYREAYDAWKANAWMTVDNALMRYFIVPVSPTEA